MGIFDFLKKKNDKSQQKNDSSQNYQGNGQHIRQEGIPEDGKYWNIPDEAVVFHDNGITSGKGLKEMVLKFQDSIGSLIVNHLEGMKKAMNDSSLNSPLDCVIKMKDDLRDVIIEKMQLVLKDGESHSRAVTDINRTVLINITCLNCKLSELKEKYEREVGPYMNLLERYIMMAQQNGIMNFVHIIYCYSPAGSAITAAYINLSGGLFIKPNELISDEQMCRFGL